MHVVHTYIKSTLAVSLQVHIAFGTLPPAGRGTNSIVSFPPCAKQQIQKEERAGAEESNGAPLKDLAGAASEHAATAATTSGGGNSGGGGGGSGDGAVRWYERAYDYWEDDNNCPLDDDGVLGGYGHISPTDVAGSGAFLDELQRMRPLLGDTHAAGGGGRGGIEVSWDPAGRLGAVLVEQMEILLRRVPACSGVLVYLFANSR